MITLYQPYRIKDNKPHPINARGFNSEEEALEYATKIRGYDVKDIEVKNYKLEEEFEREIAMNNELKIYRYYVHVDEQKVYTSVISDNEDKANEVLNQDLMSQFGDEEMFYFELKDVLDIKEGVVI